MLVGLIAPLVGLGISYLGQEAQRRSAADGAKAASKSLKGRAKVRKMESTKRPSSEGSSGSPVVPSAMGDVIPGFPQTGGYPLPQSFAPGNIPTSSGGGGGGDCPGAFSVRIGGRCVDLTALPPGGDPAVTGQVSPGVSLAAPSGMGQLVAGYYGIGVVPRVEARTVRECPPGFKLGKDGVCYENLSRTQRMWDPGVKPLLTGGDRNAIARAARAAGKLERSKKAIRKASKALGKVC